MTTSSPLHEQNIMTLLPAIRHAPTGFTASWHCNAGSSFRIKNLIATRIHTSSHDCWTLEPAPDDVEESEWTTISVDPSSEGGAVFYRGNIIDRLIPSPTPGELDMHCMERAARADYEVINTDRYPARIEHGCVIRYLADGSMTRMNHAVMIAITSARPCSSLLLE